MGLRTIPVLMEIAAEMHAICPEAWLLNFSNPAGMVTEALLRYAEHSRIVGLCNVPTIMHILLSQVIGVESRRVRIDFAGLNHMVFGLRTYLDGVDISERALNLMLEHSDKMTMSNIPPITWEPDFIHALGVIPCPYHRYYYKTAEILQEQLAEYQRGETRAEVVHRLETDLFRQYRNPDLDEKPAILEQRGGAYYSDAACRLIDALYNDTHDIQAVNVRNNGAILDLPVDSAVEVSSLITKEGPRPLSMGELPVAAKGLVQQIKSFERLAAEAAVTGDYRTGLLALTINPLIPSDTLAKRLFDEMLAAHRNYLPQFV
jgi:6-phospho-beta-glucosidase